MAFIKGSLSNRVAGILMREGATVAGMVIDEQHQTHKKTPAQARMLARLAGWYCPIILVEQNPPLRLHQGNQAPPATHRTNDILLRAAGQYTNRVIKGFFNAMVQTDLAEKLAAYNIDHVVILGQETNCCVRCTAIGADDIDKTPHEGLVQHGIRVLSTIGLLYSTFPAADFLNHPMVEIYAYE